MECKYIWGNQRSRCSVELIDTLWNVNKSLQTIANQAQQELIDTLWNVNDKSFTKLSMLYSELIDTLWNVNSERQVVIRSPQQN